MTTRLIELNDGLLVKVQSGPDDRPRQIVATAASRVDGAMDQAGELLSKAVRPIASVWDELTLRPKQD